MTKQEIVNELKKYGIEATLRPRKAILVELLERVKEDYKNGKLTDQKVTFLDDIYEKTSYDPFKKWLHDEADKKAIAKICDPKRSDGDLGWYLMACGVVLAICAIALF